MKTHRVLEEQVPSRTNVKDSKAGIRRTLIAALGAVLMLSSAGCGLAEGEDPDSAGVESMEGEELTSTGQALTRYESNPARFSWFQWATTDYDPTSEFKNVYDQHSRSADALTLTSYQNPYPPATWASDVYAWLTFEVSQGLFANPVCWTQPGAPVKSLSTGDWAYSSAPGVLTKTRVGLRIVGQPVTSDTTVPITCQWNGVQRTINWVIKVHTGFLRPVRMKSITLITANPIPQGTWPVYRFELERPAYPGGATITIRYQTTSDWLCVHDDVQPPTTTFSIQEGLQTGNFSCRLKVCEMYKDWAGFDAFTDNLRFSDSISIGTPCTR